MDLGGDIVRDFASRNGLCKRCNKLTIVLVPSLFGVICLITLWWMCGLGYVIYRLTKNEHCEPCAQSDFMEKAKERRMTKLFLDDVSQYDQPSPKSETIRYYKWLKENVVLIERNKMRVKKKQSKMRLRAGLPQRK
ncbi:hypothetical protein WR25_12968 [Diploscapter pachys]|uniref:Uncharacterized protein n=1 Tax=Diploscapter pachys TaxID=2018661 RepID=A0A2A2K3E5_9BILA|nr:hypothetical protein WR25_12968 [Diploscapter pachys]